MSSEICIVGGGMNLRKHLTMEGLEAIKNSASTLVITGDFETAQELLSLHGVSHSIIDLMPLYEDGGLDNDNYLRILDAILDEAYRVDSVTVIVNGDPLVGMSWWNRLEGNSRFQGNIKLIPGISSMVNTF
jgi:precorrin-6B methylase 1